MGQKKTSKQASAPSTPSRPAASSSAAKPSPAAPTAPPRPTLEPRAADELDDGETTLVHPLAAFGSPSALGSTPAGSVAFPAGRMARPSTPKKAASSPAARQPTPSPTQLDSLDAGISAALSAVLSALSTLISLFRIVLIRPTLMMLGWAWAPLLVLGIALGAALLGWRSLQNGLAGLTSISSLLSYTPLSAITPLTCLLGIYCPPGTSSDADGKALNVGKLAHSLRIEATRANDIFESVIGMSDLSGAGGGLHQTEIWELAMSVKRGSKLEGKDVLASELVELGDLTRDMKDKLIGINSQGINSFTWILHSFAVLETSLQQLSLPPAPSSPSGGSSASPAIIPTKQARLALQRQLTQLIGQLSSSLSSLQESVEGTIPLASRASALGGKLQEEFLVERLALEEQLADEPLWAPLLSQAKKAVGRRGRDDGDEAFGGVSVFRRDIVKRDMKLAGETVGRLRDIRRGMEDVREELVGYRDNVGYFKAGVVGWFAGGPDDEDMIDVQSEMDGLRHIMGRFEGALRVAKSRGREPLVDSGEGGAGRLLGGERLGLAG